MRATGLLALIGALFLGGWFVLRDTGGRESGVLELEREDFAAALGVDAPIEAAGPTEPVAVERTTPEPAAGPVATAAPEPLESPESPSPALLHVFEGEVVVRDSLGRESREEDGELWFGPRRERITVPVVAGRFRVELEGGDPRDLLGLELGDRITTLAAKLQLVPNTPSLVEATWIAPTTLRVVSAATGADLDGVDVAGDFSAMMPRAHPGEDWSAKLVARGRPSPIALGSPRNQPGLVGNPFRSYSVRAPGHAWRSAVVNLAEGVENLVELVPGGDLEVLLEGGDSHSKLSVMLELLATAGQTAGPGYERWLGASVGSQGGRDRLLFESLPAGDWSLHLQLAQEGLWSQELALVPVRVEAGRRNSVRVPVPRIEPVELVPLTGLLVLDESWGDLEPALHVIPLDANGKQRAKEVELRSDAQLRRSPSKDPGWLRTWIWEAGDVPAGTIQLSVEGTGWSERVEVAVGQNQDLRIAPPPAAEVELQLVHAATGAPLEVEGIAIREWNGDSAGLHELLVVEPDDDGALRFALAPGDHRLAVNGWDDPFRTHALEVLPGRNSLRVELLPPSGVNLSLRCEGRVEPASFGLLERIELDGALVEPASQSLTGGKAALSVRLAEPGTYRFHLRELDGYRPVRVQVVDVPPGAIVDVEIELERAD